MSTLNYATLCSAIEASDAICREATAPPWVVVDEVIEPAEDADIPPRVVPAVVTEWKHPQLDSQIRIAGLAFSHLYKQTFRVDIEPADVVWMAHARTALVERNQQCRELYQQNLAMRAELERLLSVLGDVDCELVEKLLASIDQEPA